MTQIDTGSGGVAEPGPIDGLITVQPTRGFGAFLVDPEAGRAHAIPVIDTVERIESNYDVILSDGAAYALGSKTRNGQASASDVSLVKIDLATGAATQLAHLGWTQETDASSRETLREAVSFRGSANVTVRTLRAASPHAVLVEQRQFNGDDHHYRVFDPNTGEQMAKFAAPASSTVTGDSSCSALYDSFIGLEDGRLAGLYDGMPAIIDARSGEIAPFAPCGHDRSELGQFVSAADMADYMVVRDGHEAGPTEIAWFQMTEIEPAFASFVEGDGDLWWIVARARSTDGVEAIVGGVAQFDLATEQIEAVYPLGDHLGRFTDCSVATDRCERQTIREASLRYLDDRLVIVDPEQDSPVLILDPATRELSAIEMVRGTDVDFTITRMLGGDPNAVWLEVQRLSFGEYRDVNLATGSTDIERLDLATGAIDVSLAAEDLFL